MPVRLNDTEAEKLVLERGLITPEKLAPYRVQASVDSSMLYDILVNEGVITPEIVAELEKNAPPPAAPRSISSRPTGFLQKPTAPTAPEPPPPPGATANTGNTRRLSRVRGFEDTPASPGSSGSRTAVISPATAYVPPPSMRPPSGADLHAVAIPVGTEVSHARTQSSKPRGWPSVAPADPSPSHVQQFLLVARQSAASDLYLNVGAPASVRIRGEVVPLEGQAPLTPDQVLNFVRQLMTPEQLEFFNRGGDLAFSYSFFGGGRYRATAMKHRAGCDLTVRVISDEIPTLEQLGFPPAIQKLTQFTEGLILIAGQAGSGKTTTMMSLVNALNQSRHGHILMLEDPAEYHLKAQSCEITQREIGTHAAGVQAGFHAALREDADILVVGELRDHETTMAALLAAEAGQLVFSTVSAPDCARAIDRVFECPDDPAQIRNMLADNLRAMIAQQLVPRIEGSGRIAACELLINSISVGNIIREAKTQNLINVMQTGKQQGLIMLDDSLKQLVADKLISGEEAFSRAKNKTNFMKYLEEAETVAEPAEEPPPAAPPQKAPGPPGRK